jgi:bacteriocin-like protein
MEEKAKRIVHVEIDDEVKKLTIEGTDKDQQVVMREELSEDELDNVSGGSIGSNVCIVKGIDFNTCSIKARRL